MGNVYIGVNNIAKKVNSIYVGVNNIARKVSKAYVGVNNIAREFYSKEKILTHGTTADLSFGRTSLAATTVGNYALFAGGFNGNVVGYTNQYCGEVDTYDSSLTKSVATDLSVPRRYLAATAVGNYALFAAGQGISGSSPKYFNTVDTYSNTLTKGIADNVSGTSVYNMLSTTVGNYALFAGGGTSKYVNAYDASLTKSLTSVGLTVTRQTAKSTTVGNYALFAGGNTSETVTDTYDTSLTKGTAAVLSPPRSRVYSTTVGDYAIFAGGIMKTTSTSQHGTLFYSEYYDKSLTKSSNIDNLSAAKSNIGVTTLGDYALFAGGQETFNGSATYYKTVDTFDTSLTKGIATDLSVNMSQHEATTVGSYALFGGGNNGSGSDYSYSQKVDYYQYA